MVQSVQALSEKPLVALQTVMQQMREQKDPKELTQLGLDYIRTIFAAPLIWMALYDPSNHRLVGQGGVAITEDLPLLSSVQALQPGELLEQVVIEQRPLGVPDISREPRMGIWQKEAKSLDIQGCIIYPIRTPRRCMGVLMLGSQLWGVTTSDEEQALIMVLLEHLGSLLLGIESSWKQDAERRIEEPLLALASALRSMDTLEQRVKAVIAQLQVFIGLNRVQVYWFDRERSQFILRWGAMPSSTNSGGRFANPLTEKEAKKERPKTVPLSFSSRDLGDLYYSLIDGETVTASEAAGTTRSEVPVKLMQQIKAQAMMVAPLLLERDLYGFITVESDTPHRWLEEDRQLLMGASALLAMAAPLADRQVALEKVQQDQSLVSKIGRSIYSQDDWQQTIQQAMMLLGERLKATSCLLFLYEPSSGTFSLCYEHRLEGKKGFPKRLKPLNSQDWSDLLQSRDAVSSDNYREDIRLTSWRNELLEAGVKSLIVAHTATSVREGQNSGGESDGTPVEGVVMVAHQSLRYWSREEQQLVRSVGVQLGVVLRQWQLEQTRQQQAELLKGLAAGVTRLQSASTLADLYSFTADQMALLLDAPMAMVVTWLPGDVRGRIQAIVARGPDFEVTGPSEFNAQQDGLIHYCLEAGGVLEMSMGEVPPASGLWLNAPGVGQIIMIPLGFSGEDMLAPLGILLVGADSDRTWTRDHHLCLELLSSTSGWSVRRLQWTQTLQERGEVLNELNWYKYRRLFDAQALLVDSLRRLGQVPEIPGAESTRWQKVVEIAHGLRELIPPTQRILKQEIWTTTPTQEAVPIASLIRKTLRRLETLVQKRKIWPRVHGDTAMAVLGDSDRLEMVLYEVVSASILRSEEGGRLEIWNQENSGYLEMMVVDLGKFDPDLLAGLSMDPVLAIYADPLITSSLNVSPGIELGLCQRIIQRMSGQLMFYESPDGRNVSRILLPLATEGMQISEGLSDV